MATARPSNLTYPSLSQDERVRRLRLARDLMEERELAALLVFGDERHPIDSYFTNDRPGLVLVIPRRGEMIGLGWSTQVIAAHLVNARRGEDSWIADLRRGSGSAHVVGVFNELGLERSRVGVVGVGGVGNAADEGYVPYKKWCRIVEGLPQATFVEVQREIYERICIKSAEEIELLKFAALAGERACEALLDATHPGVSERELYATAMKAMIEAGARATWVILQTGTDNISWGPPAWFSRSQPPRVIRPGDMVMAELFPHCGMQETQQQMCIAVGEISEVHERCADLARQAYDAGIEVLCRREPTFGELVDAMEAPVKEAGGWNLTPMVHGLSHLGHESGSVALEIGQHLPDIQRYRNVSGMPTRSAGMALKPGMAFAFEPNCNFGDRRANIGGTVVMTDGAPLELNSIPNRLNRVAG